eukprot:CAMPEP_0182892894 /NCGR_PEP_ID=MMETSP0034_2-20130328/24152_1 /TAXON_ID=156128 /ORGANISM="Nephroselmis pyriformis, Strain CCMP717" /LENGTH=46 /DNA_ID= /DNA_START= /DNA_END= /DNA_ORIENTATION=
MHLRVNEVFSGSKFGGVIAVFTAAANVLTRRSNLVRPPSRAPLDTP